jgi:hypothetical protein
MTRVCVTSLLVLSLARGAFAQQPAQPASAPPPAAPAEPVYPTVRVGMLSYLQYDAELENRDGYNAFDLTRAYININAQLSRKVRFRFTPDIRRINDPAAGSLATSLVLRVKYGFAQIDTVGAEGSWSRFGLHQTPWLDFEESINRYRVQGTMFSEREGLIPGSADFGASYFTPLPKGYGEIHGGVYNGEGFTQIEANKYKSFQGRLTVRPLPNRGAANGLRISGFYNSGWYSRDRPRRLGIAMASYEQRTLVVTIETVNATENPLTPTGLCGAIPCREFDRSGWSAFIEPRQGPTGWAGLARVDAYDPDQLVADNSLRRVIVGGAYWLKWNTARVGLVATNERVHYGSAAARQNENRLLLQTHVEF